MKTEIIILNWNGWKDTIACLDSLQYCENDFVAVVVDNGSTDDSVAQIRSFLIDHPMAGKTQIVELEENYGFAKGNNEGIRRTLDLKPDAYLLLNNDTVVEPGFLTQLETFAQLHKEYVALTPLICYFYDKEIVWNAGGKQFFGMRQYFYADRPKHEIKETGHIDVTFLTGCALYFQPELLNKENRILTEDFFFGEEDFEFCLRMNEKKRKMACVLDSKIYHKVSASTAKKSSLGKVYIHYLNRFIDMRRHSSALFYRIWTLIYIPYIKRLLRKQDYDRQTRNDFVHRLLTEAQTKDKVTKKDFEDAIR